MEWHQKLGRLQHGTDTCRQPAEASGCGLLRKLGSPVHGPAAGAWSEGGEASDGFPVAVPTFLYRLPQKARDVFPVPGFLSKARWGSALSRHEDDLSMPPGARSAG